jgi:hypothetical protein
MTAPRAMSGTSGTVTVATTATLIAAAKPSRKSILIQNVSAQDVYVGYTSAVTTSTGIKISAGSGMSDDLYTGAIYGIVSATTSDVRYAEVY